MTKLAQTTTTLLGTVIAPKLVNGVADMIGDTFDDLFTPTHKFSIKEIHNIKECRRKSGVTDEHLAYTLNTHLGLKLKVNDYAKIWA